MHDVPLARVYLPYTQHPNRTVTLVARAHADTGQASRAIAAGIRHADPMAFADGVRTVAADIAQYVAPIRLMTMLLAGFALAGVLLAGLGVFGTMSYTVMQQRRDLAVRSALGASRSDLLRMVFTRALLVTAAGIAIGSGAATLATRGLRAYLFGVAGSDPFTYTATALFLVLVSLAACYVPARRAATTDPLDALRGL
jgi:putative ABC transport system permease protein